MQVIFRGDPIELARGEGLSRMSLDLWGAHFPMGQPVDVSHLSDGFKARLRNNAHFEVVAEATPAPIPQPAAAPIGEAPLDEDGEIAEIEAMRARVAAKPKAAKKL